MIVKCNGTVIKELTHPTVSNLVSVDEIKKVPPVSKPVSKIPVIALAATGATLATTFAKQAFTLKSDARPAALFNVYPLVSRQDEPYRIITREPKGVSLLDGPTEPVIRFWPLDEPSLLSAMDFSIENAVASVFNVTHFTLDYLGSCMRFVFSGFQEQYMQAFYAEHIGQLVSHGGSLGVIPSVIEAIVRNGSGLVTAGVIYFVIDAVARYIIYSALGVEIFKPAKKD